MSEQKSLQELFSEIIPCTRRLSECPPLPKVGRCTEDCLIPQLVAIVSKARPDEPCLVEWAKKNGLVRDKRELDNWITEGPHDNAEDCGGCLELEEVAKQARIEERKALGKWLDNHFVMQSSYLERAISALRRGERPEVKHG